MIFSGVMMSAPFAVAPPLNICSTIPKTETFYKVLRFLSCIKAIFILHCTGKNAILGKLKLTMAYFRQIQEIAKEDGTQTAGILYHCM